MTPTDRPEFVRMLFGVYDLYGKGKLLSEFAIGLWWQAMRQFDLDTVRQALGRHCMNPDTGQFIPKPADVVKMLGGSTLDAAMLAWTKAMNALSSVGRYSSVCFDDAIVNVVVNEMGGWIELGGIAEKELPFKQREFENRYRAYALRGVSAWPSYLPGIAERDNAASGLGAEQSVVLIGDPAKARAILQRGTDRALPAQTLAITLAREEASA